MSRIVLNSANTAVIISDSPAFKTYDESGSFFSAVQSLSFGFSVPRQNLKQIGTQDAPADTIIRNPDVKLDIDYNFSPTFANEELLGINYNLDYKPRESVLTTLKDSSYNFYLYNYPDQGADGIDYVKSVTQGEFPNGGEVVSIGNAYLTNYELSFSVGSVPRVRTSFDCSNIITEKYETSIIQSPAINLESGNNSGVGGFDLSKTRYLEPNKYGDIYDLDRTDIETHLPYNVEFFIQDLEIFGQKISYDSHRLNSFDVSVPISRINGYRLGSNYVCERTVKFPINATLSFSSLVESYEAGFISGLIDGEEIRDLKIKCLDCNKQITSLFYFENLKLASVEYQTLVNGYTNYSLEFTFQIDDEFGMKSVVTEQDIGATRFIDNSGVVKEYIVGDIPDGWVSGRLDGYQLLLGDRGDSDGFIDIGNSAFEGCTNMGSYNSGEIYFPPEIATIGNSAFKNCTSFPGWYFDLSQNLTSLGNNAFENCYSISEIYMPDSLVTIGDSAFRNCYGANDIELSNVVSVGDYAFSGCIGLRGALEIPDSTTYLGSAAFIDCSGINGGLFLGESLNYINEQTFKNCSKLSFDLTIPNNISGIGDEAFYQCSGFNGQLFLSENLSGINPYSFYSCSSLVGDLVITDSVSKIYESAFENCFGFGGFLSMPSTLEYVGDKAFKDCVNLTSAIRLPSDISGIGSGAFMNCTSFNNSLVIPSGIQSIGEHAFSGCNGINDIYISSPPTIFEGDNAFVGINGCMYVVPYYYNDYRNLAVNGIFQGMPVCYGSIDSVVFDAVNSSVLKYIRGDIPQDWWSNQSQRTLLVIGSSCKQISSGAFSGSNGLEGVLVIPENVNYIGDHAFSGCSNFEGDIIIPDTVDYLGSGVFENCSGFNGYLDIGDGVLEIYDNSFKNCSSISGDLILPTLASKIGDEAFYNCSSFDGEILMGFDIQYIGDGAFYNCKNLSGSLEIPFATKYIGDYSFYNCTGFDGEFIMSEQAISIGNYAFSGCSNMVGNIDLPETLYNLGSGAFYDCSSISGSLYLEDTKITKIYQDTFRNCSLLSGPLVIPDGVDEIGDNAFNGCVGFTDSITITDVAAQSIGINSFLGCAFDELIVSDIVVEISQGEFDYFKNDVLGLTLQNGISGITDDAFAQYSFIGPLILPPSIQYIGDRAFSGCNGFDGYYDFFNSNVTYIGNGAFYNLTAISGDLDFPDTLEYVGDYAFYNNTSVDGSIIFGDTITGIGSYAFYNINSAIGSLTIPDSVSGIGEYAFYNCRNLDGKLYLSNQLLSIEDSTFYDCQKLTGDLVIPDSVLTIANNAFTNCFGFDSDLTITDYAAASLLGKNSFDQSDFSRIIVSSATLTIEDTEFDYFNTRTSHLIFQSGLSGIGDNAFDNFLFQGELNFPDTLTYIGDSAFENCDGFSGEIVISSNVTSVGADAFRSCGGFSGNLILPDSLLTLGDGAFVDCVGLNGYLQVSDYIASIITSYNAVFLNTNFDELRASSVDALIENTEFDKFNNFVAKLNVIETVDTLGSGAFDGFGFLDTLTLNDSVSDIGAYAFSGDTFVGDLGITATFVREGAFYNCSTFDGEFSFPYESTQIIEDYAFYNCSNLSGSLLIPGICQSIGNYAFYNNNSLNGRFSIYELDEDYDGTFVVNDVRYYGISGENQTELQSIGQYAFAGNSNISGNVVLVNNINSIGQYCFLDNSSLDGYLVIGSGLSKIPTGAFKNCSSLKCLSGILNIPETIIFVEQEAFYNCSSFDCSLRIDSQTASTIGVNAFFGTNFTGLIIPSGVSVVSNNDYDYFINEPYKLIFESGVSVIGEKAFDNYSFTGTLDFTPTISEIRSSGFQNCTNFIGDLVIPPLVDLIEPAAFENCGFDGELFLHEDVSYISREAFKNCSSIDFKLIFPNSLTYIGDEAFYGCSTMVGSGGAMVMPPFLSYIGDQAFTNCSSINGVYIDNLEPSVFGGENAFSGLQGYLYTGPAITQLYDQVAITISGKKYFQGLPLSGVGTPESVFYTGSSTSSFGTAVEKQRWEITEQGTDYVIGPDNVQRAGYGGIPTYQKCWLRIGDRCEGVAKSAFEGQSNMQDSLIFNESMLYIDDKAFYNCQNVTYLEFGNFIEYIGVSAFYNLNKINQINLTNSLKNIGDGAFQSCTSALSLNLGNSIENIGAAAFNSCTALIGSLDIPDSTSGIGSNAFQNCYKISDLNFGSSSDLTSIGDYAFYSLGSQAAAPFSIEFPILLNYLGSHAFTGANIDGNLNFPPSLNRIRSRTFQSTKIQSITDWGAVNQVDSSAFESCVSLKQSPLGANHFELNPQIQYWDTKAFYGCGIEDLKIHSSLDSTKYHTGLFAYCTSLSGVSVYGGGQSNMDYINSSTFLGCTKLKIPDLSGVFPNLSGIGSSAFQSVQGRGIGEKYELFIPSGIKEVQNSAFSSTINTDIDSTNPNLSGGISGIYFYAAPSGDLTTIGTSAFFSAPMGYNVVFPSGIKSIGNTAFGTSSIAGKITIPPNIESLGTSVFSNCNNLEEYIWEDSLTTIPDYTFYQCTNLSGVDIPNVIENIGNYAFELTSSYSSVLTLPTNLVSMGAAAFKSSAISNVLFNQANEIILNNDVFRNCDNLTNIDVKEVYQYKDSVFRECSALSSVILRNPTNASTVTFTKELFYDCNNLTSISFPTKLKTIGNDNFRGVNLEHINLSATVLETMGNNNFYNAYIDNTYPEPSIYFKSPLTGVSFPSTLKTMGTYNFYGCSGLQQIIFPSSLESMGNGTFYSAHTQNKNDSNFSLVNLYNTKITNLGSNQFYDSCVEEVLLPSGLLTMLDSNFADFSYTDHTRISGIVFPDNLLTIRNNNFQYSNIIDVDWGIGNFYSMGNYNFDGCTKFLSGIGDQVLRLPEGIYSIGNYNFTNCPNISGIEFPDSLRVIGTHNFTGYIYDIPILGDEFIINSGIAQIGDSNFRDSKTYIKHRIQNGFEGVIGNDNWRNTNIQTGFFDCTSSLIEIGSRNWYDCQEINEIHINFPATCWQGTQNFGARSVGGIVFRIESSVIGGYDSTWSGNQGLIQGDSIVTL